MINYENLDVVLPHNYSRECYLKKVLKLLNTVNELGGTIYEVAADAGLVAADHFMKQQYDELAEVWEVSSEDLTVVTEVYVDFGNEEPFDKIFLYSDDATKDGILLQEGTIHDRKLVIPFENLKVLHEKGYKCIYGEAKDGRNGKAFARYTHCFDKDRRLERYQTWEGVTYVGDGFNRALLVRTAFETTLVMPDLYAVQQGIKTFYAENLVREMSNADFQIERIYMQDEEVLAAIDECRVDILGSGNAELYATLPDSYKKLIYQIAFLKIHYPQVYDIVWDKDFEADDERHSVNFDVNTATMGICLGSKKSYAVCVLQDGSVKRVPNMDSSLDTPLCRRYGFKGYGMIRNAGTAASRMAIQMKNMKSSAEMAFDVEIADVFVTHPEYLPDSQDLDSFMKRRRRLRMKAGKAESSADLIAYEQIEDKGLDGKGMIMWAAGQAGMADTEYVDALDAVTGAFEREYSEVFSPDVLVLLYQFSEEDLSYTLLKRHTDGVTEVIDRVHEAYPEQKSMDWDEWDGDGFIPTLEERLQQNMEDYMLQVGLAALGISAETNSVFDQKALNELRRGASLVKRQFRRNDTVRICFDNGYMSIIEDYPIQRLEACFEHILGRSKGLFETLLERNKIGVEDIQELLVYGEETEYPFVKEHVEALVGKKAHRINLTECVEARGAALHKK